MPTPFHVFPPSKQLDDGHPPRPSLSHLISHASRDDPAHHSHRGENAKYIHTLRMPPLIFPPLDALIAMKCCDATAFPFFGTGACASQFRLVSMLSPSMQMHASEAFPPIVSTNIVKKLRETVWNGLRGAACWPDRVYRVYIRCVLVVVVNAIRRRGSGPAMLQPSLHGEIGKENDSGYHVSAMY